MLRVAVPEDNVPVPIDVPLSLNVTDPVGVPLVLDDTPAVKVTLVPVSVLPGAGVTNSAHNSETMLCVTGVAAA